MFQNLIVAGTAITNPDPNTIGQVVTSVDATANTLSVIAHGGQTGNLVKLSNSGGALPGGSAVNTNYFLIRVSSDVIRLATTYSNAIAGVALDLSGAGTGTHTLLTYHPMYELLGVRASSIFKNANSVLGFGKAILPIGAENGAGKLDLNLFAATSAGSAVTWTATVWFYRSSSTNSGWYKNTLLTPALNFTGSSGFIVNSETYQPAYIELSSISSGTINLQADAELVYLY